MVTNIKIFYNKFKLSYISDSIYDILWKKILKSSIINLEFDIL